MKGSSFADSKFLGKHNQSIFLSLKRWLLKKIISLDESLFRKCAILNQNKQNYDWRILKNRTELKAMLYCVLEQIIHNFSSSILLFKHCFFVKVIWLMLWKHPRTKRWILNKCKVPLYFLFLSLIACFSLLFNLRRKG